MSDNFHQSVNGGTGANHIMFGHGDMLWFSDGNGNPAVPTNGTEVFTACNDSANPNPANPDAGFINSIENPNPHPAPTTSTRRTATAPASTPAFRRPSPRRRSSAAARTATAPIRNSPASKPILDSLQSLRGQPRCESGHYYLLNNYNPGYFGNGNNAYIDQNPSNTPFTIPPSSAAASATPSTTRHFLEVLRRPVEQLRQRSVPAQLGTAGPKADEYCNICNPFQYDTSIMSNPAQVAAHIQDIVNLYAASSAISPRDAAGSLVRQAERLCRRPPCFLEASDLFEGFVKKIVDQVQGSPYAQRHRHLHHLR